MGKRNRLGWLVEQCETGEKQSHSSALGTQAVLPPCTVFGGIRLTCAKSCSFFAPQKNYCHASPEPKTAKPRPPTCGSVTGRTGTHEKPSTAGNPQCPQGVKFALHFATRLAKCAAQVVLLFIPHLFRHILIIVLFWKKSSDFGGYFKIFTVVTEICYMNQKV